MPAFGVHGIGVVGPYADKWEAGAKRGGLDLHVVEGRWPSTGMGWLDSLLIVVAMFGGPLTGFARRVVCAVATDLRIFLLAHRDAVLIGHSMGAPVLLAALRLLAKEGRLPEGAVWRVVLIGAPLRDFVLGPALRAAGVNRPPPGPNPAHCFNPRDPVCGPRPRHPSWMRGVVVETQGDEPDQHAAGLYLSHPAVVAEVRGEAWSDEHGRASAPSCERGRA